MSSNFSQVGGKNKCSYNARYACNYGNIKRGHCPGYTVAKRIKIGNEKKYKMKWHDGGIPDKPQGVDFIADGPLGHGVGEGNQPDGDDSMCLPHDADGAVRGNSRSPNNQYCVLYRTEGREQRGCTQESGNRRRRRERRNRASPSPSPQRQRRRRGNEVADMLRGQADIDEPPRRSLTPQRPRSLTPQLQSRQSSSSESSARANAGEYIENYHLPVAVNRENFRYLHVTPGFTIKKVKHDGETMNGVFTTKTMRKGARLQYHGRKIDKPRSGHDEYVVTIRRMQGEDIIIDGDPSHASTRAKAVGMASFVNEPTTGEPNAELTYDGENAYIELTKNVRKGKEITVCYGPGYGKRLYKTSCPSGSRSGEPITLADFNDFFTPGQEVSAQDLESMSNDFDMFDQPDFIYNPGGNNNNESASPRRRQSDNAEFSKAYQELLDLAPTKRKSHEVNEVFDYDPDVLAKQMDTLLDDLEGTELTASQLELFDQLGAIEFEPMIERLSSEKSK